MTHTPSKSQQHQRKQFVLRHTRSLKEALVWLVKGRKGDLSRSSRH